MGNPPPRESHQCQRGCGRSADQMNRPNDKIETRFEEPGSLPKPKLLGHIVRLAFGALALVDTLLDVHERTQSLFAYPAPAEHRFLVVRWHCPSLHTVRGQSFITHRTWSILHYTPYVVNNRLPQGLAQEASTARNRCGGGAYRGRSGWLWNVVGTTARHVCLAVARVFLNPPRRLIRAFHLARYSGLRDAFNPAPLVADYGPRNEGALLSGTVRPHRSLGNGSQRNVTHQPCCQRQPRWS